MKVVYWNNQPTPYVVARFNALADLGDLDFEAWFEGMREPDRSWDVRPEAWRFTWRIVGGHGCRSLAAELREVRPDVFIGNYDKLRVVLGVLAARGLARRVALRVLPAYEAQMDHHPLRRFAWNVVFRVVDGAKVPGPDGRRFAARHGLPPHRTWPVTQSIDVDLYSTARNLDPAQRLEQRRTWGAPRVWFVYVGRMIESKGLATLVAAWSRARGRRDDIGLVLVGDGDAEARYRAATADWPEVRWLGFRQPEQLPALYGSSDVMVFPTLGDPNGLVVEEAMAAGLPVIASDASGDIEMRVPPSAGRVVPAGDAEALADAICELADDANLRTSMGQLNATRAAQYRPEAYAHDFAAFVDGIAVTPRRATIASLAATVVVRLLGTGPSTHRGAEER